jgi:hypothetical protein
MKNQGFKHIQLLIIFVSILQFSSLAQSPKYFIITGKILSDQEISDNRSVQIIMNNKPAIVSQIAATGRFRLELNYNAEYQLTFSQNNHIKKTIIVNTEIPAEVLQRAGNLPHFLMAVKLEKTYGEPEGSNPENLIPQITYSSQTHNFARISSIYDVEYAEQNILITDKRTIKSADNKPKIQTYQIF